MNNNQWYKFLTEAEVFTSNYYNDIAPDLKELWDVENNEQFKKYIAATIIKHYIAPAFKRFSDFDKKGFKMYLKDSNFSGVQSIFRYYEDNLWSIDTEPFKELLLYAITKDYSHLEKIEYNGLRFLIYKIMNDHKLSFDIPELRKVRHVDVNENVKHNLRILRNFYDIPDEDAEKSEVLRAYKIQNLLGAGFYGKAYSTDSNRVIKFFTSSTNLKRDLNTYKKTEESMFYKKDDKTISKPTARLDFMPFFDSGQIGNSGVYYAVMPKIIPFETTDEYQNNQTFFNHIFDVVFKMTESLAYSYDSYDIPSYPIFYKKVLKRIKEKLPKFRKSIKEHNNTIQKIIRAAYVSSRFLKGRDFHEGNIGYLPQRPDTFIFFDM